ncbi:MAG: ATP-binding protein [Nanoarchaeota archaeon]
MYVKRDIEKKLFLWLENKEILAIIGPRQCGKTTLLKRIQEVLFEKHKEGCVHYISFEDELERITFEKDPQTYIASYINSEEKHFFLLDEVQYVKNAGKILKLLFDNNDAIKFIITGSSTLDLNQIGSFLVGRVLFFSLAPFSFSEFLSIQDKRMHVYYETQKISLQKPHLVDTLFLAKLNKHLEEYITFGGYPAVVVEKSREKKIILLKNLFTTYIEKDIIGLYGIRYKDKIISCIKYLASILGSILRYEEVCQVSGLYHKEAKEILSILENTFVIQLVKPFHKNLVTELKKNPKVYFIDSGLRNITINRFAFTDDEYGHLLENYVSSLVKDARFWRTKAKAEVDFIGEDMVAIEVKSTPKITPSLLSYIASYNSKQAFILTKDAVEKRKVGIVEIYILPISLIQTQN